jgi:hypothetical protein
MCGNANCLPEIAMGKKRDGERQKKQVETAKSNCKQFCQITSTCIIEKPKY